MSGTHMTMGSEGESRELADALPAYEIGEVLGRGSFAVVYAARHVRLDRQVAIKRLSPDLLSDREAGDRFATEARILARLDHPHVVRVHDYVEQGEVYALVMERLHGGTLADRLRIGPMPPAHACAFALAALRGLEHAHQHGILHRDIKPANLLFGERDVVKVADFGIAKVVGAGASRATAMGSLMGTPAFMAPEQADRAIGPLSPATDVWAVGAMLYELLSGALPFEEGGELMDVLSRRSTDDPLPLRSIAPDVPKRLADAVMRALERTPSQRWQTAGEFAAALESAFEHTFPGALDATGVVLDSAPRPPAAAQAATAVEPSPPGSFVAILFTDIAGSTALLDRRGDEAADALRRDHFAALRRAVAAHGGREVKSTGDGLMVVFASAVAAVRCAVAMQRATTGADRGLPLRVGLDAGEPLPDDEDLYGMPVVVASRLCDSAEAGEILASATVCRIAGSRVAELIQPAGAMRLRGISERVSAARIDWREDAADETPPDADEAITRKLRVVIVDDERLLRTGFRVILEDEPDITVVGEAPDGLTAVDVVRRRRPDVVLMDIRMPELDGLAAAERILSDPALDTAVLMLTTFDRDEYVYEALRIGASGFLLKDTPADRLLDAVRVAASGDALLAPSITKRLIEQFARAARPQAGELPERLAELTARELEVLRLVARGLSNAEIAAELVLGENTIKTHVAHVLSKLGLRDRVQAVVVAYETGLVAAELTRGARPPE